VPDLENKLVDAHGIKKCAEQIRDKYAAILGDDDLKRAARRREVVDSVRNARQDVASGRLQ